MNKQTELLILTKTEEMIAYLYVVLRQFPKHERHVLSQEIRNSAWKLQEFIIVCNKRYFKKTTMENLDVQLALLRSQIRVAKELGYVAFRKYESISRLLDELGRMIGGWFKWLRGTKATGYT